MPNTGVRTQYDFQILTTCLLVNCYVILYLFFALAMCFTISCKSVAQRLHLTPGTCQTCGHMGLNTRLWEQTLIIVICIILMKSNPNKAVLRFQTTQFNTIQSKPTKHNPIELNQTYAPANVLWHQNSKQTRHSWTVLLKSKTKSRYLCSWCKVPVKCNSQIRCQWIIRFVCLIWFGLFTRHMHHVAVFLSSS